jgi:hypothetical protein
MSLQNEIDKLKTLQESFNELSSKVLDTQAVLTELNHGKQEIASSIKFKGTETNADKSLSELALDIRKIQNVNKEFQAIDYMEDVVGMRSAMEFINDVATNDYAAYACYVLGAGSKFNVATNPNAMYMSDGTLILSPNGEYEVVPYNSDTYGAIVLAYSGKSLLLENLNESMQLGLYGAKVDITTIPSNVQFFFTKDCELNISAKAFNSSGIQYFHNDDITSINNRFMEGNTVIRSISIPKLTQINTDSGTWKDCSALRYVNLPELTNVNTGIINYGLFQNCTSLKVLNLPKMTICPHRICQSASSLKYLIVPKMQTLRGSMCYQCYNLKEIYAPSAVSNTHNVGLDTAFTGCSNLENITIGAYRENLNLSSWVPNDNILDKVVHNIHANIALRVQDRTDTTSLTITFAQKVRNALLAETEEVFAAKNWNIAPAKTV